MVIDLKEKHYIDNVIENEWNFKPLFSLSEDIDFPKVQQFEQHMFQIYNSILDSYVSFKSKQNWCQKVLEEIQMQSICAIALSDYVSTLNKISDTDSAKELLQKCRAKARKCKELLVQFEQVNAMNKATPLHKAFQIESLRMLSDIYIPQEEMLKYRDARKDELKEFENQVDIFEHKIQSQENTPGHTIKVESAELEGIKDIKSKFQMQQEEFVLIWSIISTMSEDLSRFHTNLKIIESIHSTEDQKYDARKYLIDYKRHEDRIEAQKQLKPQMDEHHIKIDELVEECKSIQILNAKKIIQMLQSLSTKSNDTLALSAQKLQSNATVLETKFNYLLKPAELPELHEKCKKEFARRYWFEDLLNQKEKELEKLITAEKTKRHNFFSENGRTLPNNPLTTQFLNFDIEMVIKRNRNIPKVTDVETDEVLAVLEEARKEHRLKDKVEKLKAEVKTLKAQLKSKDQELLRVQEDKASEIERYSYQFLLILFID